ncbi:MAG: DUF3095 domain-containing protein, partial [Spirochaetia bacterium]|nr:DUF3095 domain-containing protein [Spirochaetia bacterium]
FRRITDDSLYVPVPEDWTVAITDVAGSTAAIEAGRYKDVNRAGAISVVAVANLFSDLDIPFVFGGDGVTFLLPEFALREAKNVLADTRALVRDVFQLELRVGFVPVRTLNAGGHTLRAAKFQISQQYNQAMFMGTGLEAAEAIVKQPGSALLLPADHPITNTADFTGFNCRWHDIQSHRGETVSIIVKPLGPHVIDRFLTYIHDVVGEEHTQNPISETHMRMGEPRGIAIEARVTKGTGPAAWAARIITRIQLSIGAFLIKHKMRGRVKVNGYDLVDLKETIIRATDYRKFDGTLKMVLACSSSERSQIERFLAQERSNGTLAYGVHVSDRALMTCLVNEGTAREVHFVDAADGGYAMAARMIKEQLR